MKWNVTKGTATLKSASSVTDSNGQAAATYSSLVASDVVVEAVEALGFSGNNNALFTGDPKTAAVVLVEAAPPSILANGAATTELTATVVDSNGNAVPAGIAVQWTTNNGTLAAAATPTEAGGKARVKLTAPTAPGQATITAKART
ncbi:Ig-like domain-containing protein, partial [Pseudomonas aeruginosa]